MSNSVSAFIGHSSSTGYNSYFLIAESSKVACNLSLGFYSSSSSFAYLIVSLSGSPSDFNSVNLDKDQITHLLSLDCPDAFIAYALTLCPCPAAISVETLCPCPPETAKPALVAVDGGILFDNGLSIKNILCAHCLNATPEPELTEFLGWCYDCFYTT